MSQEGIKKKEERKKEKEKRKEREKTKKKEEWDEGAKEQENDLGAQQGAGLLFA